MTAAIGDADVNAETPKPTSETSAGAELSQLLERARQGDAAALPALRQYLERTPELWRDYGDLAAQVRVVWVRLASGPDLLRVECLTRQLDALVAEVAGASPSPLERLLAERVAICWLQASY